ncbi:hypothetical protein [Glutamicibacter sp. NPDC087344]|uniref:hypothetical protein n=1 Tax=Glutamicibacter sp. NPDC087344 TaxID=3363994 RepID=UPI00381BD616
MSTFLASANNDPPDARTLYVWDRDVSLALLAGIALLEVALRNALNEQLVSAYGANWLQRDIGLDERSRNDLSQAWRRLSQGRKNLDRLVSHLMFGFWRDLLSSGGYVGREPQRFQMDYEELWRTALHGAFPGGKVAAATEGAHFTRTWTLETVTIVHAARNRAAHHEPFISGFPLPGQHARLGAQQAHEAILKLAGLLDRDSASALLVTSSVPSLLASKPQK